MAITFPVCAGAPALSGSAPAGSSVRVAGIVLKWVPGDRAANYQRAERLIREAAGKGARIVCTPESFLDGYSIRNPNLSTEQFRSLAEPVPNGVYFGRLRHLADELDIYLIAAITELDGENVYNSAVLIGPDGKLMGTYRKKFLWIAEEEKYSAGNAFPAFETPYGKVGIMICFDRRHPAAIKELVENGAEIVFCPAGGGYGPENQGVVRQRSREGKVPIVFVHPIEFLVTGPDGSILANHLYGETLDDIGGAEAGVVRCCDLTLVPL
jgi:predicted amidohydrolase